MTDMSMKALLEPYDINLPLRDALEDPTLSPDRRALAAAAFRQELNDALYPALFTKSVLKGWREWRKPLI